MPKYGYDVSFYVEAADEEAADEIVKGELSKLTSVETEIEDGPNELEDEE